MITATKKTQARVEQAVSKLGIVTQSAEPAVAYVNHGRWVADCACNGGELVAPAETMLCGSCGRTHTVKFPGPKTRQKIEAALSQRVPLNQNWHPDETVDELVAQNIENGMWENL